MRNSIPVYFEKAIRYAAIFKTNLEYPNASNAQYWADRIEAELSPENLTCDGELRRSEVLRKKAELEVAKRYLALVLPTSPSVKTILDQMFERRVARTARTFERQVKLENAVNNGFVVGAKVRLSNGLVGVIQKVNRTRVMVLAEDTRKWSVPPRCMTLVK
jgi:hypothetical protein